MNFYSTCILKSHINKTFPSEKQFICPRMYNINLQNFNTKTIPYVCLYKIFSTHKFMQSESNEFAPTRYSITIR
jgi:hypothetical protein